jgi:hypothetical protein
MLKKKILPEKNLGKNTKTEFFSQQKIEEKRETVSATVDINMWMIVLSCLEYCNYW